MLNEGQMLLICRFLDARLNKLKKLKNMDIDKVAIENSFDSFHDNNKKSLVKEISEKLGLDFQSVNNFFEHPSFQVLLNFYGFSSNTLANCFYAAPTESIIKVVDANLSSLDLSYEDKLIAEEKQLQTIVKTTRTKVSSSQYSVSERLINIPKDTCNNYFNKLYTQNLEALLADKTLGLKREDKIKLAIAKSNEQFWHMFEVYSSNGTFNDTLVSDWTDYMKFFDEKYGQVMVEKDINGTSLWKSEGFTLYDNRALNNGESITLEDQLKLSLAK